MRSIWIVFVIGLATSEKLLVSSQTFTASDDMYLEGQSSGGLPSDDEDLNFSGSGLSELDTTEIQEIMNKTRSLGAMPLTPDGTPESTVSPTVMQADTPQTEVTGLEPSDDPEIADTTDSLFPTTYVDVTLPEEKGRGFTEDGEWDGIVLEPELFVAESIWQRTEVLAAVIACGVVGFLCALFLVMFIAYRMKKKDEGSYALGVAKVPPSAYQKQPPKEFYA